MSDYPPREYRRELEEENARLRGLLERLSQWDMFNCDPPCVADGPFWKREIEHVLGVK